MILNDSRNAESSSSGSLGLLGRAADLMRRTQMNLFSNETVSKPERETKRIKVWVPADDIALETLQTRANDQLTRRRTKAIKRIRTAEIRETRRE